ncbi:MAG TPA: methylmalonyl Co-A mutase-associated GTPase MeaB [Alphaproteobacteria bacterium]|nr:methylmalonyl Co-A mutase-associated GTPase MeaB [Alphaproteobacteria bacterium]
MSPGRASASLENKELDPSGLAKSILTGDRRALARAITLVESTRSDHRAKAETLLARLLPHTGKAVRIGVSGSPGVGKSTFIEAFGLYLIERGHQLAVLAVDPSSRRSGGSILGDKTRMSDLARVERAFIRPSPSGGTLGGVARRTREVGLVCEAAGFDVVLVETVGVGQSETAVADMVDLFLLLLPPAGGDELQGLKKGIVELADIIAVNKADGDLKAAAVRAAAEYTAAMPLIRGTFEGWRPPVLQVSALERRGMQEVWEAIERYRRTLGPARLAARRRAQATAWMWNEIEEGLLAALRAHPRVAKRLAGLEAQVSAGVTTPTAAAQAILAAFRSDK